MPAMLRKKGKATKIAEAILDPNKKKKEKKPDTQQEQRLVFEETRLVR